MDEKTEGRKSRDTVPLNDFYFEFVYIHVVQSSIIIEEQYIIKYRMTIHTKLFGIYYTNHQHPHNDWRQGVSLGFS
jgi:hypothetical protein